MKMLNTLLNAMRRVSELKKNTDVNSWNYRPCVLNVADDATRITYLV